VSQRLPSDHGRPSHGSSHEVRTHSVVFRRGYTDTSLLVSAVSLTHETQSIKLCGKEQ
jgi:hypothetical protein